MKKIIMAAVVLAGLAAASAQAQVSFGISVGNAHEAVRYESAPRYTGCTDNPGSTGYVSSYNDNTGDCGEAAAVIVRQESCPITINVHQDIPIIHHDLRDARYESVQTHRDLPRVRVQTFCAPTHVAVHDFRDARAAGRWDKR